MKVRIITTNLDLTPSVRIYIYKKLKNMSKLLGRVGEKDAVELALEVGRTTRHHHKGYVFRAEVNLRLPGKLLRAVDENVDVRAALDTVKDKLHAEIEKYKTKTSRRFRRVPKRE